MRGRGRLGLCWPNVTSCVLLGAQGEEAEQTGGVAEEGRALG